MMTKVFDSITMLRFGKTIVAKKNFIVQINQYKFEILIFLIFHSYLKINLNEE